MGRARRSGDQAFPHLGRCGFGATIATRSTDARKKRVDKSPNAACCPTIPSHWRGLVLGVRAPLPHTAEAVILEGSYGDAMTQNTTQPAHFDQAIEAAVEAEIRDFVERDSASLRGDGDSGLAANTAVTLVQRIRGTSVQEIDGLLAELQTMRALLQKEGERVQHQFAEYAHLCQSAEQSTKIIADRLNQQRKPTPNDATLTARNSLPAVRRKTDPLSEASPSNERRRRTWWSSKEEGTPERAPNWH